MVSNRINTADLLKGIAVLLMIQVHMIELFATEEIFKSSIGKILLFLGGPPVAPLFMLILGYFIAAFKRSNSELMIRGFKIFLLGMLLNLLLNLNLIASVNNGLFELDLYTYIFGVDILHFAGLSIIFIALIRKFLDKYPIFGVILLLISAYLGNFLLDYVPSNTYLKYVLAYFYGCAHWSYFPFFPWIAYVLSGFILYQIQQKYPIIFEKTRLKNGIFLVIYAAFLVLTIQYGIGIASDLQSYYHHGILFFGWVILFLSGFVFIINEMETRIGNNPIFQYLKWLGKNVTWMYVIQWIIIGNLATEIYKTVSSPHILLFYFVGIVLLSSLVTLAVKKVLNEINSSKNIPPTSS